MSALHCGYCTFAESLVPAFFKVSIDHLCDNLESLRINYCFGKSLEKVLKFGSKNLYQPYILMVLTLPVADFCFIPPSHDLCLFNKSLLPHGVSSVYVKVTFHAEIAVGCSLFSSGARFSNVPIIYGP